jgi:hypothetical protein
MVTQTTYTRTNPISFVSPRLRSISVPNPRSDISVSESASDHYSLRSESAGKNMVEDMVKAKSDPIQSVYIPTPVGQVASISF